MKDAVTRRALCLAAGIALPTIGWQLRPPPLMLVGDSTVARRPGPRCELMGWGHKLAEVAYPKHQVLNRARGGSTCSGFLARDWRIVRDELKPGTQLLVQFGHVDAAHGLSPRLDYRPALRRLLDDAVARGARPLLCTPVASWLFHGRHWLYEFADYADEVQRLADALRLPLLDLGRAMGAKLAERGPEAARAYFMLAHDGRDRLHLNVQGATLAAQLVLDGLSTAH